MRVAGLLLALVVVLAATAGTGSAKPKRPQRSADLRVVATGPADRVLVGADVLYRVRILNRGPNAARRLVLRVEVPVAVRSSSLGALRGARCEGGPTPGPVRCKIPRLPSRGAWTLELVGSASEAGELTLTARVRSATPDPRLSNNRVTVRTPGAVGGPPPAAAEAASGTVQMKIVSYCWMSGSATTCADAVTPDPASLAPLTAHPGETVTFRLGFEATSAGLDLGRASLVDLAASASPAWRVPDDFETSASGLPVQLSVRSAAGSVSYWTRLIVTPRPLPPPPTAGPLAVPLLLASYCIGDHVDQACIEPRRPPLETLEGLAVHPGDLLRFDLKFGAQDVELVVMKPTGEVVSQAYLPAGQSTTWRVPDGFTAPAPGVLVQLTISSELQYAVYFGRLVN